MLTTIRRTAPIRCFCMFFHTLVYSHCIRPYEQDLQHAAVVPTSIAGKVNLLSCNNCSATCNVREKVLWNHTLLEHLIANSRDWGSSSAFSTNADAAKAAAA